MRVIWVSVLALAVGCSSGGSTMAAGQLAGTVYEVDGQSTNLAGVQVTLKETGQSAWTDASGGFAFGGLRAGRYTLGFDSSLMAAALQEGGAASGDGEDDGVEDDGEVDDAEDGDEGEVDDNDDGAVDDAEDGDDEFEDADGNPKVDVPDGGTVQVDVALEGGKVKDFASDEGDGQHAMAKLHLTDAAEIAGYHVAGGIKIAKAGDHTVFKVCVEGLSEGDVIGVRLGEAATSIGTATANGDGRACLVLENSIPLGAANLGELKGKLVQVFLGDLKLLTGEVPALHEEGGGGDGAGDEPKGDGDHPGGGDASGDGDKPAGDGAGDDEGSDGNGDAGAGEDGEGDSDADEPGDNEDTGGDDIK